MACQNEKISWLHSQIQDWVRLGIIDAACGESITKLYPSPKSSRSWALLIFSGLGAVVIGLGVILLFAYNWDKMDKFAKLATVFGSLILAHLAGVSIFTMTERFKGLGESLCLLGTMLFGAGIWLVAQIYHIEEHFPNAFLFWGMGAFLMAWAMPSVIQAILAAVLFTIWAAVEGVEFNVPMYYVFIPLLLLLPLAYDKRAKTLLCTLLLAIVVSLIFVVVADAGHDDDFLVLIVFNILLGIFAIYTAAGLIQQKFDILKFAAPVCFFTGLTGYFIVLYILTWPEAIKAITYDIKSFPYTSISFYWFVPLVFALVGWGTSIWQILKKNTFRYYSHDLLLMPFLLIFFCCFSLTIMINFRWPAIAIFNLVFLAHAAMMMAKGCMDVKLSRTIIGSLMLIALIIARFTDLFDNLAIRGAVFVVAGILIFGQGFFYVRSKKKKALQENECESC